MKTKQISLKISDIPTKFKDLKMYQMFVDSAGQLKMKVGNYTTLVIDKDGNNQVETNPWAGATENWNSLFDKAMNENVYPVSLTSSPT